MTKQLARFLQTSRANKLIAFGVALSVAGTGYVLIRSSAAGFFAATEPEAGTLTANAQLVPDASASGGQAIRFSAPTPQPPAPTPPPPTPTPTPPPSGARSCPAYPAFPDASCTGVTPGVVLSDVTTDVTYGSSFNGQTISGKNFKGFVTVTGANITFKDCIFRGKASSSNHGLVDTEGSTGPITFMDIEVVPSNPSATLDGMWLKNSKVYRAHVHGGVDGIKTFGDVLIEDSYIHNMNWFASDPNQGGGETHNDGVQSWAGPANTTLRHNTIDMSTTANANAAWQDSSPNSLAEKNYLDGGGCTLNFAHASLSTLQPIYVRDNHFGRNRAFSTCAILISTKSILTENLRNVYHDNGQPIPSPNQHD